MKYPIQNYWLKYEKINEEDYFVLDLHGIYSCEINQVTYDLIRCLDGKTDPFDAQSWASYEEINDALTTLESMAFIRSRRLMKSEDGRVSLPLWNPKDSFPKTIAKIYSFSLSLLWLPLVIIGLLFTVMSEDYAYPGLSLIGGIVGGLIGTVFHEVSHALSGIIYDADVREIGLTHKGTLHGYTRMDLDRVKNRMNRIRVLSAGLKANMLLSGICLLFSALFHAFSAFFLTSALINGFLAALNVLFHKGLDGYSIIDELLGTKGDLYKDTMQLTKRKSLHLKLRQQVPFFYEMLFVARFMAILQFVFLVLLLLISIWGIFMPWITFIIAL